jgi:hypothetical protein
MDLLPNNNGQEMASLNEHVALHREVNPKRHARRPRSFFDRAANVAVHIEPAQEAAL